MKALAILGPGRHARHLEQLRAAGLEFPVSEVDAQGGAELIAVLGGDGTIHRFLPQLLRAQLPVLILPSGSGNDFAQALGIDCVQKTVELASDFVAGSAPVRDIDLGIITDSSGAETPFCCVGGFGLDAIAAEFANKMPRWLRSRGGYLLAAGRAVLSAPRFNAEIHADNRQISADACLFSFANAPSYGGGLRIAPDARLDDGLLDCVFVDAMSGIKLAKRAPTLLKGTHLQLKEVTHFRAKQLQINADPVAWIYADGEPVCQTPVQIRVNAGALRFLCGCGANDLRLRRD